MQLWDRFFKFSNLQKETIFDFQFSGIHLEIFRIILEKEFGEFEPDIRERLKAKYGLKDVKNIKLHLERLETRSIIAKQMVPGKSNIWKVNTDSLSPLYFFSENIYQYIYDFREHNLVTPKPARELMNLPGLGVIFDSAPVKDMLLSMVKITAPKDNPDELINIIQDFRRVSPTIHRNLFGIEPDVGAFAIFIYENENPGGILIPLIIACGIIDSLYYSDLREPIQEVMKNHSILAQYWNKVNDKVITNCNNLMLVN